MTNKTEAELKELSKPELRSYADDLGLKIKGNPSEDTLVQKILERQTDPLADYEATEVELEGAGLVPERLELAGGEYVQRAAILKAVVRDLDIENSEWNALTEKDKDRKIKAFIGTLDLKPEDKDPEAPKAEKGSVEHAKQLLSVFTDRGLKLEFDGPGVTMSFGPKLSYTNLSVPDHVLVGQARVLVV